MKRNALVVLALGSAAGLALAAPAGAQVGCEKGTVVAHLVALDQPIVQNRMGASLPGGMIFALARDVCTPGQVVNGQTLCQPNSAPTAGKVMVKPYKRPRPVVLRVNEGQCLQIGLTNLLSPGPLPNTNQPPTRLASVHVQGLELVSTPTCAGGPMCNDGSWVGNNPRGVVGPTVAPLNLLVPQINYTLLAAREGSYLLYSAADAFSQIKGKFGDGGQLSMGLFGAVHVEPANAEWYRSQVTATDLTGSTGGRTPFGQPLIAYKALYQNTPTSPCFQQGTCRVGPVLFMKCGDAPSKDFLCRPNEIIHSDLTAIITGRDAERFPTIPPPDPPTMASSYALPDRQQPFREFTIIYHEMFKVAQAFPQYYALGNTAVAGGAGADQFGINYGMGGIGSEVLANRFGIGPMANCTTCKFEEFFLTSWAVGDPAMVVDRPATNQCTPQGTCANSASTACNPDAPSTCPSQAACNATGGYTCKPTPASKAFFPDDPSNVYHSYISDHTIFRILHGGSDLHHVHHQHAHQWLHSPDTSNGDYLDSQSIGPGSSFSLEMTYNSSGNVNQTVGDSIFHCHFYPHFAGGMWSLWRVHDVLESGTKLDASGVPLPGLNRALPDGELFNGSPIPALVPLPTLPMPPMPGGVRLADKGATVQVCDDAGQNCVQAFSPTGPPGLKNPGFPFFVPGIGGQRAPHPPLDFALDDDGRTPLDGGLPRHLVRKCPGPGPCVDIPQATNFTDFSKFLTNVDAFQLPEAGTFVEDLAMRYHERRLVDSFTPEGCTTTVNGYDPPSSPLPPGCPPLGPNTRKAQYVLNGLPRVAGAPFADPCIRYTLDGGRPPWHAVRSYKAVDIQLDVSFNKEGWHFPQQRMLSLWNDAGGFLSGTKPPEPFFFRANSGECIQYTLANLVPNVYELDDFQVRTPTDVIGQHIHLVKFDVTSSDGATNGFNYEDGTFGPNEVLERIAAINARGGLWPNYTSQGPPRKLTAKPLPFFGPGPGGQWLGAQATVQRWYTDRLFDGTIQKPGVDRTLRTVFTHDHFGPSTHQQAGLYAGLVIEPGGSQWFHNEGGASAPPFGGEGVTPRADGGPTTWQAVIVPTQAPNSSFREFLLEFQDTTLTYAPFTFTPPPPKGFCADGGAACTPATASQPASGCSPGVVCFSYGFCSNSTAQGCTPDPVAGYACGVCGSNGRCNNNPVLTCGPLRPNPTIASCTPTTAQPEPSCNLIPGIPSSTWQTTAFDTASGTGAGTGGNVELITLGNASNSFSVNYRSEPLYPRINNAQGSPVTGQAGDLSYAYASLARPNLPCAFPGSPICSRYPKLTNADTLNDPFTPILRSVAGDDVQVRTLVGAHINPHNFTIHGVKWLVEPSFVDSGWRNSQEMGISEHFEEVFRLPSIAGAADTDYVYMAGAAGIEQAGGNWGLVRAYAGIQPNLTPLPQNRSPAAAPVCPSTARTISFAVVALTAQQALPNGQLVYNTRGPIADPNAILYFQLQDLSCPGAAPAPTCKSRSGNPDPLVLRANAGDCLNVALYNMVQGTLGAGAPAPVCAAAGGNCTSNTSPNVGLHPQLVTFDARVSNGFNAGNNPDQVATPGTPRNYIWYAGNIDPTAPAGQQHIPVEFGAANLLPSDVLNHAQYGLFGALVIEPPGSTCGSTGGTIETCRGTTAQIKAPAGPFREFVLVTRDGITGPQGPGNTNPFQVGPAGFGDSLNTVNYRSEPLFIAGTPYRSCQTAANGVACVLSSAGDAQCCTSVSSTSCQYQACGEPQTPILQACAGDQVRFRVLHAGGINTNQVFELYGHSWQEQPNVSSGKGCVTPTTQTNLYSSTAIGTGNGCGPLEQDTFSEYQGSRMGHGPTNHFDLLVSSAGGPNKVAGDYLYRSYPADHFALGLWGIFRVLPSASCQLPAEAEAARSGPPVAAGGGSR